MRISYLAIFLVVLLSAFFWRFVNYDNRWTLSQDQARDAIIANYAIENRVVPLVGPPSSIGIFSFGPIYYWIIILFKLLFPFRYFGPWVGFTLLSVATVLFFFFLGKQYGGKVFASILGLVAAFSSASIFHSVDMLNPMLVLFFTTLALFSLIKKYYFLLGLSVGLAISAHFQALGLLSLLVLVAFIQKEKGVFLKILAGFLISLLPLIYLKNFFSFLLSGQTYSVSLYLWLKDLILVPKLWGEVLFFIPNLGYFILALVVMTTFLTKSKTALSNQWWIIVISFLIQIVGLLFYQGAKSPVYLLVFHPFIIFLTAWAFWMIGKQEKLIGITLMTIFLLISSFSNLKIIQGHTQKPLIFSIKKEIDKQSRGKNEDKIALYTQKSSDMISLPLLYLYLEEKRISDSGFKLGVCNGPTCPVKVVPFLIKEGHFLYYLNEMEDQKIIEEGFKRITNWEVYNYLSRQP